MKTITDKNFIQKKQKSPRKMIYQEKMALHSSDSVKDSDSTWKKNVAF
jgi:hypothetical protein